VLSPKHILNYAYYSVNVSKHISVTVLLTLQSYTLQGLTYVLAQ